MHRRRPGRYRPRKVRHTAACRAAVVASTNAPPGWSWSWGWPVVLSRHCLVAEGNSPHTRRSERRSCPKRRYATPVSRT